MPIALGPHALGSTQDDSNPLASEWQQYKATGSTAARNRLVTHYMRVLVRPVALRMKASLPDQVDVEDLVQQGYLGLIDAMGRFEPERHIRFETYARRRVFGAIQDYLRSVDPLPRLTRSRYKKLQELRECFHKQHGRPATETDLRPMLDVPEPAFVKILSDGQPAAMIAFSAAQPGGEAGEDGDGDAMHGFADPRDRGPLGHAEKRDLQRWITRGFDDRDRLIIILYYYEQMTMLEIGQSLGISESRVSQRLDAILGCLRSRLVGAGVRSEFVFA